MIKFKNKIVKPTPSSPSPILLPRATARAFKVEQASPSHLLFLSPATRLGWRSGFSPPSSLPNHPHPCACARAPAVRPGRLRPLLCARPAGLKPSPSRLLSSNPCTTLCMTRRCSVSRRPASSSSLSSQPTRCEPLGTPFENFSLRSFQSRRLAATLRALLYQHLAFRPYHGNQLSRCCHKS